MNPDLPHTHEHKHDHQAVPSDPALRVKALESLLVEKGLVDRGGFGCVGRRLRTQDRSPQRRTSRGAGLGPILRTSSG